MWRKLAILVLLMADAVLVAVLVVGLLFATAAAAKLAEVADVGLAALFHGAGALK